MPCVEVRAEVTAEPVPDFEIDSWLKTAKSQSDLHFIAFLLNWVMAHPINASNVSDVITTCVVATLT